MRRIGLAVVWGHKLDIYFRDEVEQAPAWRHHRRG